MCRSFPKGVCTLCASLTFFRPALPFALRYMILLSCNVCYFQEYNPGGGKDEVLKYLEESKKQVVLAERALRKIMEVLQV